MSKNYDGILLLFFNDGIMLLMAQCQIVKEINVSLDNRKKSEKIQLRTTEYLKVKLVELVGKDGISQNSVINQAIAWYVQEREKHAG